MSITCSFRPPSISFLLRVFLLLSLLNERISNLHRPSLSTGILSTFNSATIFAQMGTGFLVDKIAFPIVMVISCTSASLTAYLLLGFATTLPLVLIFVVLFGLVGGGFFTTSARGAPEIARKRNSPISLVIYTLMFSRGESEKTDGR